MQNPEQRKKNVPGTRNLILQIKALSDKSQQIELEIKDCIDKITTINEENRANSPKANLQIQLNELGNAIKALRNERKENYTQLDVYKASVTGLRDATNKDKNTVNIRSPEDIERKIDQLNMRLIAESVNTVDERAIAAELLALRTMRSKLGSIEDNLKQIRSYDSLIKESKAKIAELSQDIAAKTSEKDKIHAELNALTSSGKAKCPEIVKLDARIAALRAEKQKIQDQKIAKKEEIHAIEAEFAKFEKAMIMQQRLEEQKTAILKSITALKSKKEEIQSEMAGFDPKIFDTISYTVAQLKNSKHFQLEIGLVDMLIKYGIAIPSNAADIDRTLAMLKAKRDNSMAAFGTRREDANKKIFEIESKISEENSKLEELPPTDYEILRKAGRMRISN